MTSDVCVRHIADHDWNAIAGLEATEYRDTGLSEGRLLLESRGRALPATCFVLDVGQLTVGYLLALPYPTLRCPDLTRQEETVFRSRNLHLHDLVIAAGFRRQGLATSLLYRLTMAAVALSFERISLVAVGRSEAFWSNNGYRARRHVTLPTGYGVNAVYMSRALPVSAGSRDR